MPSEEDSRRREPAKHRRGNHEPERLHQGCAEKRAHYAMDEHLREAVQKRQCRRSEQNQGRTHGHEKKVLHHMDGEQLLVKCRERGTNGNPHTKEPTKKRSSSPSRDHIWKRAPEMKPAAQVKRCRENQGNSNRHW